MSLETFIKVMTDIINDYDEIVKKHNDLVIKESINVNVDNNNFKLIPQNKIFEVRCVFVLLYNNVIKEPDKLNKYVDFLRGGIEMISSLIDYSEKADEEFSILVKNLLKKIKGYFRV